MGISVTRETFSNPSGPRHDCTVQHEYPVVRPGIYIGWVVVGEDHLIVIVIVIMVMIFQQMRSRPFISLAEAIAAVIAHIARNMGMTILVVIIGIRSAVVVEVLPGSVDAIVKPLALGIAKFLRGFVPIVVILRKTRD